MKIAFVHPSWPGSQGTGATYSATQIILGLARRGHDVTAYCPAEPTKDVVSHPNLSLERLDVSGPPYHSNTTLNRALRRRTEEFDAYDVVNCYQPLGLPAMAEIGHRTAAAVGVTLNAYGAICPKNDLLYLDEELCTDRSLRRCTRCILATSGGHDEFGAAYRAVSRFGNFRLVRKAADRLNAIDFFRAPSSHLRKHHVSFGFPEDRIHVVPHPIDERFEVPHESDFGEPYALLYVGYLEEQKGVRKLVPILQRLREDTDTEFTLTVVGTGGLRSVLRRQAEEHDVSDAVEFTGFVPNHELPAVYASHDLFVYPGIWEEPLARVYLEALATGTPVVSSPVGDTHEVLGGGGETTDGTVQDFANTIARLVDSGSLTELSEGAEEQARRYDPVRVIGDIETLYHSVS